MMLMTVSTVMMLTTVMMLMTVLLRKLVGTSQPGSFKAVQVVHGGLSVLSFGRDKTQRP